MPWLRNSVYRWLQWPQLTAEMEALRTRVDLLDRLVLQRDEPEGSVRDATDRRHGGHWPDAHLGAQ
jgi:hypothetical protein